MYTRFNKKVDNFTENYNPTTQNLPPITDDNIKKLVDQYFFKQGQKFSINPDPSAPLALALKLKILKMKILYI